ncbi:hypothetical protein PoB_000907100, partial [Plakobranchus ocellatus]
MYKTRPAKSHAYLDWVLYKASPQQGDLRLSGPPSGQGAGVGARTPIFWRNLINEDDLQS